MVERYFSIDPSVARDLINRTQNMKPAKRGIDRCAYLFDECAVLSTHRLKLRNVDVRDDSLLYFDDIIEKLTRLYDRGVHVVPILGYCYDSETVDGSGYIFQQRAAGHELYDDAAICRYEVWTQNKSEIYLKSDVDSKEYILARTHTVANVPQKHFDKFIEDIYAILSCDILIDFQGKSNFFYDENEGFYFIDLDSHTDNFYGLTEDHLNVEALTAIGGFVPCHFSTGTKAYAPVALDEQAVQEIGECNLKRLAADNAHIFTKCKAAMLRNGIPESALKAALQRIKIYGL